MLQHAALETAPADVEAAVAFWTRLGFTRIPVPGALEGRAVWLERAGTQIHLLLTGEDAPVAPPRGHVAVVVTDYEATLDALRASGVDVEPRAEHWGSPRAHVRGPGGHVVEVMAAPPA